MNSNLLKICLASLLALSFTACGGDDGDNGVDNGDETITCTAGETKCSPDNTSTLVCNAAGNGYDSGDTCAFGCEAGACKADPNNDEDVKICTPNSIECHNNKLIKCNADGSAVEEEACAYGCESGATACSTEKCTTGATKCNDDKTEALSCNADGTWDAESCEFGCNSGACVEHTVLEDGADCNPDTYFDTCNADGVLNYCGPVDYNEDYTGYIYGVIEANCAEYDAVCEVVNVSMDGKSLRYGDCFTEEDTCDTAGDISQTCAEEYDDYYEEEYAVETTSICSASLSTSKNYWVGYEQNECIMGGCKDDTACIDPLVSDQGKECDAATRADRCDGNVLSACTYQDIWDALTGTTHVVAMDCAEDGAVCASGTVDGAAYANCFTDDDKCTTVGSTIQKCDPDYGSIDTYVCTELTGGKYYVLGTYDECVRGCTEGAVECNPTLVDDEGEGCTAETRPDACDGNILSYCDGEAVVAGTCSEDSSCVVLSDGYADCFSDADQCDTVGETKKACVDYLGSPLSLEYACVASKDGSKKYWEMTKYDECETTCSEATGACE